MTFVSTLIFADVMLCARKDICLCISIISLYLLVAKNLSSSFAIRLNFPIKIFTTHVKCHIMTSILKKTCGLKKFALIFLLIKKHRIKVFNFQSKYSFLITEFDCSFLKEEKKEKN